MRSGKLIRSLPTYTKTPLSLSFRGISLPDKGNLLRFFTRVSGPYLGFDSPGRAMLNHSEKGETMYRVSVRIERAS